MNTSSAQALRPSLSARALFVAWFTACSSGGTDPAPKENPEKENALVREATERPSPASEPPEPSVEIAIDTHVDTTQRMADAHDDLTERFEDGHLDFPRMRAGGLHGAFFSIWVRPSQYPGNAAWRRALALVDAVHALARRHPDQATLCRTADDVREAVDSGRIALLMGVEGAHALGAIDGDPSLALTRLRELYRLGVRYMTITWSNDNALGHSSGGHNPEEGLTDLGRTVIAEMNRLGIIVDVSHVSDRTFWDIVATARRPLLASHSSARALSEHPRNMSDDMIAAVAERGGAVCVNYYAHFIDAAYGRRRRALEWRHRREFRRIEEAHEHSWQRWRARNRLARELAPELEPPTMETLGAHFAHIARVGGSDAVCMGSDFDGVSELPEGMTDVSDLTALRAELERRGLPLPAVLGQNVLRVLAAQSG